jgi:hypothetical protein
MPTAKIQDNQGNLERLLLSHKTILPSDTKYKFGVLEALSTTLMFNNLQEDFTEFTEGYN